MDTVKYEDFKDGIKRDQFGKVPVHNDDAFLHGVVCKAKVSARCVLSVPSGTIYYSHFMTVSHPWMSDITFVKKKGVIIEVSSDVKFVDYGALACHLSPVSPSRTFHRCYLEYASRLSQDDMKF